MSCDRDFAIIKKALRKHDRLYTLNKYTNVIKTASNIPRKFTFIERNHTNVNDLTELYPNYYKKICLSDISYGKNVKRRKHYA